MKLMRSLFAYPVVLLAAGMCHAQAASSASTPAAAGDWTVVATYPNGQLARGTLRKNLTLGPVVCAKGQDFGRRENGKLSFCTVAVAKEIGGVPIAKDAYTLFHPDESVWQTTVDKALHLTLPNGNKIECAADLVSMRLSGVLEYCKLAAPYSAAPTPCAANSGISLYESGAVAGCTAAGPYVVAGVTFAKGTSLTWYEDGLLSGGHITGTKLAGIVADGDFKLHRNGRPWELRLAQDTLVGGRSFPASAHLWFRMNGSLEKAEYVEARGFMVHGEPWTDTRTKQFDANGLETSSTLSRFQSTARPPKFR
jgi:hypothetical protein